MTGMDSTGFENSKAEGSGSDRRRLTSIRRMAVLLTALALVTLVVSATIRLSAAGLGCDTWPECYGQILTAASPAPMDMLRITHRAVATLALLLVIALVWRSWRPQPLLAVARRSVALLVLTLALTGVGIFSGDPNRVWTSFLNMLGGVALVALSWRLVLDSTYPLWAPSPMTSSMEPRATLDTILLKSGRIALIATIVLGALIGARYAALSCATVPLCDGMWWPSSDGWSLLNPLRAFAPVLAPMVAGEPGGQVLHLLHRVSAVLTVFVVGLLGLRALSNPATRPFGWMLLLVLLIEFALGGLTVKSGFSLILAVAHSVCAAVLLMFLVQLSSIRLKSA